MVDRVDQINQLLDGELEQMLESGLYAELSVNPDLRSELRQQLILRSAVQNDRMALVPPAQLTNSVFTHLGFAAPLAGAAAGATGGSLLLSWLAKIGIPVMSAVAATGITYFSINSTPAGSTAPVNTPTQAVAGPVVSKSQPAFAGNNESAELDALRKENAGLRSQLRRQNTERIAQNTEQITQDAERERNVAQSQPVVPVKDETPVVEPAQNQEYDTPPLRMASVSVKNDFKLSRNSDQRFIQPTELNANSDMTVYPAFTLQVRGFSLTPSVATSVEQEQEWYSNLGLAFLYRLNRNHTLGFEVGNESYPMVFEGDKNGQIIRYEQYPTTTWVGATYRYTWDQMRSTPLAPFAQFLLGGTKLGPLGRAGLGIEYSPSGPVSFILGAEASLLAYPYQDTWYMSPKYGVTYGVSLKF